MLAKKKPAKRYLAGSAFIPEVPNRQEYAQPTLAPPSITSADVASASANILAEPVEKEPTILFDRVLVHYCQFIAGMPCRCQEVICRSAARHRVETGQAVWGPLPDFTRLPATKQHPIIIAKVSANVPRSGVPGAAQTIQFAEARERQRLLDEANPGRAAARAIAARRATTAPRPTHSIVRMVEEWPEFEDLHFEGYELQVWVAVFDGGVNASNIGDAAKEINVTPAELDALFMSAKQKISDAYTVAKRLKRGVFANWGRLPGDFEDVPVDDIEKRLAVYAQTQLVDEFGSLDEDLRAAFTAWATHRTNYAAAASASGIPETTLRRRVQETFKMLHEIQLAETAKSVAFESMGGALFGFEEGVDSDANAENAVMAKTGGGSIKGHILYGGTRQLVDDGVRRGQIRQRKLEGFDKALANFGLKIKDRKIEKTTKSYRPDQTGGSVGETDDYSEDSTA
jgi:hypothetical protein